MFQTICIVDDSPDIREILSIFFKRKGYLVLEASGGMECLDMIRNEVPDIILLDIMMEPVDGWQTLVQIKNDQTTRHIPVIIISGKRPTAEEQKNYGQLFVRYIMKPFSLTVLDEAIAEVIRSSGTVKM
ncbi:MAG TPA: response regulator [Methanoregulaceae archaeon]|nr:response regulator [Methanoregulaceae archaeon]